MKTKYTSPNCYLSPNHTAGSALVLVMIMCAVSLIIMAGIMYRTSTVAKLNDRNNKFTSCNEAANAAAEKVFARLAYDFQNYGLGQASNNLSLYRTNIPMSGDSGYWTNFVFTDGQGNSNRIYVDYVSNYAGALPSQYTNLSTVLAPIYRIVANASRTDAPDIIGTSQVDVLLSLVPITTYAIFYNGPLEFTKCATMVVRGRTHANDIICVGTSASLDLKNSVTATKTVQGPKRDGWTPSPWNQNTTFRAGYTTNVPSITVAMTMTNTHSIIEMPPPGESLSTEQAKVRLYNQAHVLIIVTNLLPVAGTKRAVQVTVILQSSPATGRLPACDLTAISNTFVVYHTTTITNLADTNINMTALFTNQPYGIGSFLSLTNYFTDKREYKTNMYVTQISITNYAKWLSTNAYVLSKFNGDAPPTILYVADWRGVGEANKMAVVRLVNGEMLPNNSGGVRGFSVATRNPLYVKGNYNITADRIHYATTPDSTTNSGTCVPSALLCDALTILSSSFNDATSKTGTSNSSKSNTLNAAVITGNMPSTGTSETTFSGGVHNLMRMLEDWSAPDAYLILNTSIVVLYASQVATNQFRNPIDWSPSPINPYYKPPTRQWGFDPNFYDPAKQPPGVPTALVPIRFNWTQPPPGTH